MIRIILPVLLLLAARLPLNSQVASTIAVVDFDRALAECAEGKQAAEKFNVKFEERKKDLDAKQKALTDAEASLRTQERSLNDAVRAERVRDIERKRIELARVNEDAQKELEALRAELLRPIAEKATRILNAYAKEQGFTLVINTSGENNVVFVSSSANVTPELIKRIDAAGPEPKKP